MSVERSSQNYARICGSIYLAIIALVIFYLLLQPVSKSLALASTAFNLVQTSVLTLNKLSLLTPLAMIDGASYLGAFSAQQLNDLGYLAIKSHGHGFAIGLIFFGVVCLIRGYLIFKSTFLPAALGVLLQLAGASYLINSVALILAPDVAQILFPWILLPAFVGELSLAAWLTVKGVDPARWQMAIKT